MMTAFKLLPMVDEYNGICYDRAGGASPTLDAWTFGVENRRGFLYDGWIYGLEHRRSHLSRISGNSRCAIDSPSTGKS
jgi:hypothetical protein